MKLYDHKTLGGILLVAGTAIGAGMLALPITTGVGGLYSATALIIACFLYMLVSLFLLLEANLYENKMQANIISMAKKRLGLPGQIIAWCSFLLLLYAVAAAYLSGGGSLIAKLLMSKASSVHATHYGIVMFATIFCAIIYFGAWLVDYINRILMLGLIGTYIILIFMITPHVDINNLTHGEPKYLLSVVTVVILSFTSHIIVPSLRLYMNDNVKQLKKVLLIGCFIPLLFYIVWEFLIIGLLPPTGNAHSLKAIESGPHPVAMLTQVLHSNLGLTSVASLVGAFSFFALVTSFLAVLLSLVDFLADGFGVRHTRYKRLQLIFLAIFPPLLFAMYYPQGFVLALRYAGLCVAILYGLLPPLMVWHARYCEKLQGSFTVPGGKTTPIIVFVGAILIIFLQIMTINGWLPKL